MKYQIGEICEIVSGSTPKTSIAEYWDGNVKWITPAELDDDSYVIQDTVRKITELGVKKTGLTILPKGTVLFSSRAPIGKVAIAGCDMYCNQGFKNLICSDVINNKYLYWYLKSKTTYLNSLGRGATFKELSKKILAEVELEVPHIKRQNEIVQRLERLCSIKKKRLEQLQKLDELIQARFVEMFGDLMFNQYNWPLVKIADISAFLKSGLSRKLSDVDIGLPVIRSGNIQNGQFIYGDVKYWYKEDPKGAKTEEYVLEDGDILINFINSVSQIGKTAVYRDVGRKCIYTTNIFRMKLNDNCNECYYNWFAMSDYYYRQLQNIIQPAVNQASFTTVNFLKLNIPLPPIELQNQFADFVNQVHKSKVEIQQALEKTQLLFDSLMQQYFG